MATRIRRAKASEGLVPTILAGIALAIFQPELLPGMAIGVVAVLAPRLIPGLEEAMRPLGEAAVRAGVQIAFDSVHPTRRRSRR
jgi:hypothetical protein